MLGRQARLLLSVVLTVLATVAVSATASAAPVLGPAGSAFYTPPSPLPGGAHGDLIWYRPTTVELGLSAPLVNAWLVLYQSQSINGRSDAVTGTVLEPATPWLGAGPRPVVDFAVGTQGMSQSSAPSFQLPAGTEYEAGDIVAALAAGWTVDVTDYAGYTNGAVPDYSVGASEGHAVLDIATAATQIPGAGISPLAPTVTWGYSQGGQASAWAAQLWPSYDPGLRLLGDASGGVPANPVAVAYNLNGNVAAAFLLYADIGLNVDYPQVNLPGHLNAAGVTAFAQAQSDSLTTAMATFAYHNIDEYTKNGETLTQLLAEPANAAAVAAQQLGRVPIEVPVFQYHAAADEIVPFAQDEALWQTYCSQGVTDDWNVYPGEHLSGDSEGAPFVVTWIAGRFAGLPAPSNC